MKNTANGKYQIMSKCSQNTVREKYIWSFWQLRVKHLTVDSVRRRSVHKK